MQKLEERGNRTTHNLHKMQLDLDKTQVALGNTTNKLLALQHTQFVENRVYDDDETISSAQEAPLNKEIGEEVSKEIHEFINKSYFQKLFLFIFQSG